MIRQLALLLPLSLICLAPSLASAQVDKPAKKVEIRLAEDQPGEGLVEVEVADSKDKLYLHKSVVATDRDIAWANVVSDARGKPAIAVTFTDDGSKKIADVSENNIGKRLAILVDGKVLSAPMIRGRMSKKAEISGMFTLEQAERIARTLAPKRD